MKRRVIIITDGDRIAQRAVEKATTNIGGRCISASAGNPTILAGEQIIRLIKIAKYDQVVIMVDDKGDSGFGFGERVMDKILNCEDLIVMGIVAVASNTPKTKAVKVNCSIDKYGNLLYEAVDKYGNKKNNSFLSGDTVNMLSNIKNCFIVGVGDPGKMDGGDDIEIGSPIITKAMEEIVKNYNDKLVNFNI